ncbi:MAG: CapA family protein [Alphaproteobacteria bacterium]|nr:CapA family protein [Alphaproteobacteria bacterium]
MRNLFALALAILALATAPVFAADTTLTITLTGQSMIRSDLRTTNPAALPAIKGLIHSDVNFTNFEGTVFQPGQAVAEGRGFLAPEAALDGLQALGFNLLSLANNHAFDLKQVGLANTLAAVEARGIAHAGTGTSLDAAAAPTYLKTANGTMALVASASGLMAPGAGATASNPGVNELRIRTGAAQNQAREELPAGSRNQPDREDTARILNSIRKARANADLVIAYQHNHVFSNRPFSAVFGEGLPERLAPPAWLKRWTHAEIDAGADIVVMHGAPLLHGVEIYRGKPIFYDLGNFIYNLPPAITYIDEPITWESVTADLTYQGGKLRAITLHPIAMNPIGEGQPDVHDEHTNNQFLVTRGIPRPATGIQATDILARMAKASAALGTKVVAKGDSAEIRLAR